MEARDGVPVTRIDDPADPRLAELRRLNDAAHRRRVEAPTSFAPGTFVVEGWLPLERAFEARVGLRTVLVATPKRARLTELWTAHRAPPAQVFEADPDVVAAVVGFDLHRGVVASAARPRPRDPAVVAARARRLLVVEGVTDTENLGALFRNAAAMGAEGVLVDPSTADPWSRRVVRVSMGHVLGVPWARAPWPEGVAGLRAEGFELVALTPDGEPLARGAAPAGGRVAVLVGAEGPGLSPAARRSADRAVAIPMARGVDSLNVATAAAVAMWELFGGTG